MLVGHPHLGPIHERFADFLGTLAAKDPGLARSEFKPWNYTAYLPWLFLMTPADDGDYVYRLAGTAVEEYLGRTITGARLSTVRSGRTLGDVGHLLDTTLGERKVGVYRSRSVSQTQVNRIFHRMVLPMQEGEGAIALGLCVVEPDISGDQTPLGEFAFCAVEEAFSGCAEIASADRSSA